MLLTQRPGMSTRKRNSFTSLSNKAISAHQFPGNLWDTRFLRCNSICDISLLGLKGFERGVMTVRLHKPCLCVESDWKPKAVLQQQTAVIMGASNHSWCKAGSVAVSAAGSCCSLGMDILLQQDLKLQGCWEVLPCKPY